MVELTTKIVKSTDLWSKINLCTKSLILRKINDKYDIIVGHIVRHMYANFQANLRHRHRNVYQRSSRSHGVHFVTEFDTTS
jgi:hypothetical protein